MSVTPSSMSWRGTSLLWTGSSLTSPTSPQTTWWTAWPSWRRRGITMPTIMEQAVRRHTKMTTSISHYSHCGQCLDVHFSGYSYAKDYYKDGGYLCPSDIFYGRPKRAANTYGKWKVIVNLPDEYYAKGISKSSMSSVEKYQFQGLELVMSAIHKPRDLSSACIQVREGQLRGHTGLKLVIERQLQFWQYPDSLQGRHAATWTPTSPLSVFRSTTLSGCWPTPMRRASTSTASSSRWLAPATSLHFTPSPTHHLHPFILHPPPSLEPLPHPAPTIMEQPLWHLGESRDSKGLGSF